MEKAAGSEGELKCAVTPPDVRSKGVLCRSDGAGDPLSKSKVTNLGAAVVGLVVGEVIVGKEAVGIVVVWVPPLPHEETEELKAARETRSKMILNMRLISKTLIFGHEASCPA